MSENENASPNLSPVKQFISLLPSDKSHRNLDANPRKDDWNNRLIIEKIDGSIDIPVNVFASLDDNGFLKVNTGEGFKWSSALVIEKIADTKSEWKNAKQEPVDGFACQSPSEE
jgi:hypothetical protein